MNKVKERILKEIKPYSDNNEYKDLISFYIDSYYFEDWNEIEDNHGCTLANFNEVIIIVEKDWLFTLMRKNGIANPLQYLKEKYTSKDSYEWYEAANNENKIVGISFK